MAKKFTVAIIGCGSRGAEAYGRLMAEEKDKFDFVALCDINEDKLRKYGEIFGVNRQNLFLKEEKFFEKRLADAIVIATMDGDHVRQCERALQLGYDILLEKPVTTSEEECKRLLCAHKKYGGKVVVCHVLRYAPAYVRMKELLDSGEYGKLIMIDSIEQVCYWHQAHSFVRGNWRNSKESSPMILQKCCHDLDLLQYYAGARCEAVSSMGDLSYFRRENQPQGAADRCTDCKYIDSCIYSAKNIYIGLWKSVGSPANCWPYSVLTTEYPLTEQNLQKAIETGPYGRCVYACDNDVVDHQIVEMRFFNGIKANLRMTAFTAGGGRIMKFYCTEGQIELNEGTNKITVYKFNRPEITIDCESLIEGGHNHGGGDSGLIKEFYKVLSGTEDAPTRLEDSVESHLIAIRAEESRLAGGELRQVYK